MWRRGGEHHAASGHAGGVSLFMGIDLPYRITALESWVCSKGEALKEFMALPAAQH